MFEIFLLLKQYFSPSPGKVAKNVFTALSAKCPKAFVTGLCFRDAIFSTVQDFWLFISSLPTVQKCVCLLQVFSLNLIAFYFSLYDSVAVLFYMEFADSTSDCGQFSGFNLCVIEEQVVDYES